MKVIGENLKKPVVMTSLAQQMPGGKRQKSPVVWHINSLLNEMKHQVSRVYIDVLPSLKEGVGRIFEVAAHLFRLEQGLYHI